MRDYQSAANVFKALNDVKRLQILDMIRDGEKCACVILEDMQISQSTLSHHMKILCESGIVHGRKDGKWVHYSIDKEGGKRLIRLLSALVGTETL